VAGILAADEFPAWIVGGLDGFEAGDRWRQLGDALGRRAAAKGTVRAMVVVEGSPRLELGGEVRVLGVDRGLELLERGALDALDLAVQVRRAGPVGPELDVPLAELVLDLVGEELLAAVGLHPLHGERHLGHDVLEEVAGVGGGAARVETHDLPAGTIIDRGVLVETGPDLAGVHLHPVPGTGRL
jgi:hypothetical protein